jgi:TRAP-type C4-dicarboxylate transport system permease small subunit
MGSLAFLILADVVGRAVFNHPIVGTPEIVAHSVVVIAFLQLSRAVREETMLSADFLRGLASPKLNEASHIATYLLGFVLFALLTYGSAIALERAYTGREFFGDGAFTFTTVPVRAVMTCGCMLAALEYLLKFLRKVSLIGTAIIGRN